MPYDKTPNMLPNTYGRIIPHSSGSTLEKKLEYI